MHGARLGRMLVGGWIPTLRWRSRGGVGDGAIEGEITIGRPIEEVFDFVADERNEPQFNAKIASAELLSRSVDPDSGSRCG